MLYQKIVISKIRKKVITFYKKKIGYEHRKWCLAFLDKKNLKILKVLYPPKNEFWADPFIFKYKKKDYCFFERFYYDQNKGEIACGEIKNNNLVNIKTIFKSKFHLSFPYIFKFRNSLYFICETYQKKKLEIFVCKKFPYKWKLYSTGLKNIISADPIIINYKKKLWLLVNQTKNNLDHLNRDLYVYKINSLKKFSLIPHSQNPLIKNFNGGRNASGNFFYKNNVIRLSQKNNLGYGEGINVSKIGNLNLKNYSENKLFTIKSTDFRNKNIIGIHSINSYKKTYLVDICYDFFKKN